MKPSVAFVLPQTAPAMGMERAALSLIGSMARTHKVTLVSFDMADPLHSEVLPSSVERVSLRLGRGNSRLLRAIAPLRSWMAHFRGPVVSTGLWATLPCLLAQPTKSTPLIIWEHSLNEWRYANDRRVRLLSQSTRPLMRRASAVVCVSQTVEEFMQPRLPEGVLAHVIPNPVRLCGDPTSSLTTRKGDWETHLLSAGSLRPVKNFSSLIRAMKHTDSTRLDIAGYGPMKDELHQLIQDEDLGSRVQLLGYVPDVARTFPAYDVYVQPSHAETFGVAVVEAGLQGVPVVTSGQRALDELVPQHVVGVSARNASPHALAEAIRGAQGDLSVLRARARTSAPNLARRFSPETIAVDWAELLVDL